MADLPRLGALPSEHEWEMRLEGNVCRRCGIVAPKKIIWDDEDFFVVCGDSIRVRTCDEVLLSKVHNS